MYIDCREQVLFSFEYTQGQGKSAKTVIPIVAWTTGYHHYPLEGGRLDQPSRLMAFFDEFRIGDRRAAYEQMKTK